MQNYYSERLGFFLSVGDTVWYLSESGAPLHRAGVTAISELGLFQDEPDFVIQYGVGGSTRDTTLGRLRPESHFQQARQPERQRQPRPEPQQEWQPQEQQTIVIRGRVLHKVSCVFLAANIPGYQRGANCDVCRKVIDGQSTLWHDGPRFGEAGGWDCCTACAPRCVPVAAPAAAPVAAPAARASAGSFNFPAGAAGPSSFGGGFGAKPGANFSGGGFGAKPARTAAGAPMRTPINFGAAASRGFGGPKKMLYGNLFG